MKKFLLILLILVVSFSYFFYEGEQMLFHYMFGDGSDLILKSNNIHNSPVIRKRLSSMKVGEVRRVAFNQEDDYRLSYAVNGFDLKKTEDGFEIEQYIKFDTTGKVFTYVKLPFIKLKIYDNWVHFVKCTPYTLRYKYSI